MNQEELAGAATKAVCSVELLSDRIKKAAASLGVDQNEVEVLIKVTFYVFYDSFNVN